MEQVFDQADAATEREATSQEHTNTNEQKPGHEKTRSPKNGGAQEDRKPGFFASLRRFLKSVNGWKGIMGGESRRTRFFTFLILFFVAIAISFVQAGFFYFRLDEATFAYAMTLLAPITCTALLLGKGYGCLSGAAIGGVLFVHARIMPLDLYEKYYVWLPNTVVLYMIMGFITGLLFAIALRNGRAGKLRLVYIGIICAVQSYVTSINFVGLALVNIFFQQAKILNVQANMTEISEEQLIENSSSLLSSMGDPEIQSLIDFLLMFVLSVVVMIWVERVWATRRQQSVGGTFNRWLFGGIACCFLALSSISFVAITIGSEASANESIGGEAYYIAEHVKTILQNLDALEADEAIQELPLDSADLVYNSIGINRLLIGYDVETDGTIMIVDGNTIVLSDNPAYPAGADITKLLETDGTVDLSELAKKNTLTQMLYSTTPPKEVDWKQLTLVDTDAEIGYMRVAQVGSTYVIMAWPSSMVFANRWTTMTWVSLWAFVLLLAVYLMTARLLKSLVVEPIHKTNESLSIITSGNLEEQVTVNDNIEFASLSEGINTTVGALRGWIAEAETRMERELATAKAIQESALPRTFPPFPEIEKFDLYASMNAAKEVGGDFYDFFLIDDKTLGFLIADVSGKGIPGALFMMAAKSELRTFMESGMELSQAVAGANARLCANNDAGMFVTVWAATLEWETGLLTYVNAGHNFPLLRHGSDGPWEWVDQKCGLFLGTFEKAKYKQRTLMLEPHDELVLYTDGVNEAFSVDEEEYGNDRLEAFLNGHTNLRPRAMVEALRGDVAQWAEGAEQSDDITILSLEYGVAPELHDGRTFVATLDNVPRAVDFVLKELDKRMCPLKTQHKIEIALEELLVNICRYAYVNQEEPGKMQVNYVYTGSPSSLTIELVDQGIPFNPLTREDPTAPTSIKEAKIGGLGIFMVKKSMDDITYAYHEGNNVLVFKKGW